MFATAGLLVALVAGGARGQVERRHHLPATEATSAPATAPEHRDRQGGQEGKKENEPVVTEHEVTVGGKVLRYKATAGTLTLKDDAGKPRASVFFVAYDKMGEGVDPATRPITYVFNGGPGAASVWLHLGAVGPRRIDLLPDGLVGPPPYRLVDNEQTWLDLTDLVFIDPVGTGYSRPAEGQKADQFFGVEQDIAAVAEFIRLYTTKYQRWASPKFLAGESYGTTRAAGLSEYLIDHTGIALNGILFVSTVLDFATIRIDDNNAMAFPLQLPTYAAVAWYHHKLPQDRNKKLEDLVREVQHWALTDYMTALAKGDRLGAEERKRVVDRLVEYTGLSPALIEQANLRISPGFFQKHLLADERKIVGRFDARVTGFATATERPWPEYDPSLSQYYPVYSSTFNDYVRRELKYESDLTYEVLSSRVGPWDFGQDGGGYLTVAGRLRTAMAKNPFMKLMFAAGYFDLATPFGTTDYTVDHFDLSPALRKNITQTYYMGGHMMYHDHEALVKFKQDVSTFLRAAATATTRPITTQPGH